jgi:Ca2+-transporting ATPase
MGKRGTDVAREASSVVLLDDSFSSIVAAIRIGRRIFRNLRKASSYLLTIHIPITVLSIVPVIMKLPALLLPVHIAFLHLIIEPASTMIFEALPEGNDLMKEPPRTNSRLLFKHEIFESLFSGIILSVSSIGIYLFSLKMGLEASDARGMTFTTLILTNLFLIFLKIGRRNFGPIQGQLKILALGTILMLSVVLYIPFFRDHFRFNFMHLHDLIPSIVVSVLTLLLMALVRLLYRRVS